MEKKRCRRGEDCWNNVPARDPEHSNPSRKGMGRQTLPWRRISVCGFAWMSNGHLSLPLVSRVPAACFPSRFCMRCLHILYKQTNMLKQCDGKVFLHFSVHVFFAHVSKIKRLQRLEVKLILEKLELLFLSHYHVYTLLKYFFIFQLQST